MRDDGHSDDCELAAVIDAAQALMNHTYGCSKCMPMLDPHTPEGTSPDCADGLALARAFQDKGAIAGAAANARGIGPV